MSELEFQIASESAVQWGEDPFVFELHHEAAKQRPSDLAFTRRVNVLNNSRLGHEFVRRAGKTYACAQRVALPAEDAEIAMPLTEALRQRRSVREFAGRDITLAELAVMLRYGNGTCGEPHAEDHPRRAIPSGGGLYPTELYVLPLGMSDLPAGAYHYDARHHLLSRFLDEPAEPVLARACFAGAAVTTASLAFAVSVTFERQSIKYGERAYRFALMECGHLAQNLLLVGTALGLGTLPFGGFLDDELNGYLHLDGTREAVLYVLFIG
ncbi:MAG TPA: SagB/ThcOx family dehydrogenase [Trebonia sp.]|jgi:SagB-type dehydrogenase family enzyme|nr:SagB/ThcOx family dehydrogenase [Trebonia sp.]